MTNGDVTMGAREAYARAFGRRPDAVAVAPGRVNLIGEHTDYSDGFVLPMAIDRHTACAGRLTTSGRATVVSRTASPEATFDLDPAVTPGDPPWSNYVRGVVAGFQRRGARIGGLEVAIDSQVPLGGGLSSSASLEVAIATLLETLTETTMPAVEKIRLTREAEHEFAGVPCGIMDQSIVVLAEPGHALLLDCRTGEGTPVAMTDPELAVLVINTNVRHNLGTSEYPRRREECEEAARQLGVTALRDADAARLARHAATLGRTIFRRARHVISENARTLRAADALRAHEWAQMGRLMYDSHRSLRDDFEVSCDELDAVVDIAWAAGEPGGVWGCRMTGGGFGGCAVALVQRHKVAGLTAHMASAYRDRTGREATIFATQPSGGARAVPA